MSLNLRERKTSKRARGKRRGVAVVMVLGLLAITLALSYSMLRGQTMTAQLQQNFTRTVDARYAAQAGMNAALRKMHEANWQGVDVPVHGKIDEHTGYDITYTTGDASLTPSSPAWSEYPFRVTVRVVGYAENPDQPAVKSTHTLETVVQLVRRAFNSQPSGWTNAQAYALYQWATEKQTLHPPFRIEGNAFMLGELSLAPSYPPATQRARYFSDLNLMRIAGLGDYRPFGGGTLTLNLTRQGTSELTALQTQLAVPTLHTGAASNQPVAPPAGATTYQLYPGGKAYEIPSLQRQFGAVMQGATAQPDPVENPLGVFRSEGWMTFGDNAKVIGTVLSPGSSSDLVVAGKNVEIRGYNLPPLEGSSEVAQLPALLVRDDLIVYGGSGSTIKGLAMVWNRFQIDDGATSTSMNLTGKLLARNVAIGKRTEWNQVSNSTWTNSLNNFLLQVLLPFSTKFYPQYFQQHSGFSYQPKITFKPDSTPVRYHWQDWNKPVYVKGASDPGLRWQIISQRRIAD